MFDLLGYPVVRLHRERVGAIRLGGLEAGRGRSLTRAELGRTGYSDRKAAMGSTRVARRAGA